MKFFKRPIVRVWLLLIISIPLLSLPFLVDHLGFTALFGLVPLFFIDEIAHRKEVRCGWLYFFLYFLFWNIVTTYWICYASFAGGIAAVVVNSLQMSLIFWLFRVFRKRVERCGRGDSLKRLPYIFFIALWLAWEHFYFDAEISWPWLTLGNSFAGSIKSIQWYEYTGVLGGSLWILLSNVLLYFIISKEMVTTQRKRIATWVGYATILIAPFIVSAVIYNSYNEKIDPREFVVLQPNIEPYQDKFNRVSRTEQDNILMRIAEEGVTDSTLFLISPETFTWTIYLDNFDNSVTIPRVRQFLNNHPNSNFILGAVTLKTYPNNHAPTLTAKKANGFWYDTFNSSIFMDSSGRYDVFHKSKLVVLTEFVPFPKLLAPINKLAINLGGASSSYATQPEISIFTANDGTKIGTAICYESVYGDYYRGYVNKGAQVMAVITNDGWWDNTPGYKQHLRYSSLRAIETRRSIARSANTGISALIDQRGERIVESQWWKEGYLKGNLNLNSDITFFVRYGDIIGRVAIFLSALLVLFYLTIKLRRR